MSKLIISSGQGCNRDFYEGTDKECNAILQVNNGVFVDENNFVWHLELK